MPQTCALKDVCSCKYDAAQVGLRWLDNSSASHGVDSLTAPSDIDLCIRSTITITICLSGYAHP